jgi:hypothetical protein
MDNAESKPNMQDRPHMQQDAYPKKEEECC